MDISTTGPAATSEDLEKAGLVLVMTKAHKDYKFNLSEFCDKVFTLADVGPLRMLRPLRGI